VRIDAIPLVSGLFIAPLDGKDQQPTSPQGAEGSVENRFKRSEVDQRIGGDDQIEGFGMTGEVRRQFGLRQLLIDVPALRFGEHAGGQIHPGQMRDVRSDQGAAKAGAAARIESDQPAGGRITSLGQRTGDQLRRTVVQALQFSLEAPGEAIEGGFDIRIGGTGGHVVSRARGEHVVRDRVGRLVSKPIAKHAGGSLDLAEPVVGDAQEFSRLGVVGHQRDRLAIVGDGLLDQPPAG